MSQLEWAMWANEQALTSCSVLFVGSVVGIAGMFNRWQFGIYGLYLVGRALLSPLTALVPISVPNDCNSYTELVCNVEKGQSIASLFILIVEWPRGKRRKGNTILRRFQRPFTLLVDKLGIAGRNYFIRFTAYLLMCIPCCFTLATLLGGICLLCTGAIYFLAAIKGEEWAPAGLDKKSDVKKVNSLHPPKKAPPRPNVRDTGSVDTENIDMEIVEETRGTSEPSRPRRPPPRPTVVSMEGVQEPSR